MMASFKESFANISGSVNNLFFSTREEVSTNINHINSSVSSPSTVSGDDSSDRSQAIPSALIKEQWQVILGQDASIFDLNNAIERCKELVLNCEECSVERKWLVRHLVELRYRVREIQDIIDDPQTSGPTAKIILGHHFINRQIKTIPTRKQYCDHCSGIIWNVVQASYICADCSYCVHHKCLKSILRICAHIIASERKNPIEDICPELGLSFQQYKCIECQTALNFKSSYMEPKLCDYTGLYYCQTCHWNDTSLIPARIIHNWDFTPRKISRASLQEFNLMYDKPVINLEEKNPKLFVFVQKLSLVKKLREDLNYMRKYLSECKFSATEKILDNNTGTKRYLIQSPAIYSISDLVAVENGNILELLYKFYDSFEKHIRKCDLCYGKGYHCEICSNDEVIFPFDDGAIPCNKCNSIYHRICWLRKKMICQKCNRLEERKVKLQNDVDDKENGNNDKK